MLDYEHKKVRKETVTFYKVMTVSAFLYVIGTWTTMNKNGSKILAMEIEILNSVKGCRCAKSDNITLCRK
jgi:hypothetical protein